MSVIAKTVASLPLHQPATMSGRTPMTSRLIPPAPATRSFHYLRSAAHRCFPAMAGIIALGLGVALIGASPSRSAETDAPAISDHPQSGPIASGAAESTLPIVGGSPASSPPISAAGAAWQVPVSTTGTPVEAARPVALASTAQGVSANEIRFGIVAPFSGPAKDLGHQMQVGIEAAFNAANATGGVFGRKLSLVTANDGYDPAKTGDAMKQLDETQRVFGFVGNVGTPTAAVSLPYALARRMLFYGAFTGAGLLRNDPPDRYVFNFRASYAEETYAVVRYLVKSRRLQPEQIAVFAQHDGYGDAGFQGVEKAFRSLDASGEGASVLRLDYERNTVNVDDAITRLRQRPKNAPQIKAIVMVATYRAAAKFIEKTADLIPGLIYTNVSFVGSTSLADELMVLGPKYASGVIVTQVVPAVDNYSSVVLDYRAALTKSAPGEVPDYVSLEGYLSANILIEGLKRAGPDLDTEKLVKALESIRDYDLGVGPRVTFGGDRHQALHKVWGTQIDAKGHFSSIDLE